MHVICDVERVCVIKHVCETERLVSQCGGLVTLLLTQQGLWKCADGTWWDIQYTHCSMFMSQAKMNTLLMLQVVAGYSLNLLACQSNIVIFEHLSNWDLYSVYIIIM